MMSLAIKCMYQKKLNDRIKGKNELTLRNFILIYKSPSFILLSSIMKSESVANNNAIIYYKTMSKTNNQINEQ